MSQIAVQETYCDDVSYCYGCGRLNPRGLHIESFWDEEEGVCTCSFLPKPEYLSLPGFVYGGLIASLIDCHAMGTASAVAQMNAPETHSDTTGFRFVTRALKVDYLAPTPMGVELRLRGRVEELTSRKAVVKVELFANEKRCATGEVIAIKAPDHMFAE